jgi:uncharacterized membrane protein YqjE
MSDGDPGVDVWRARLVKLTLIRLVGIAVAFVGLVWAATNQLGKASPVGGAVLIVVGLLGSLWLSRRLRRSWLPPA